MIVSVIILSRTSTQAEFELTTNCIHSLFSSEKGGNITFEILLIESNRQYLPDGFVYPDTVQVIVPDEPFNFHAFLNIGIGKSSGSMIALCNNDLIFHHHWMSYILTIKKQYPSIKSFSPLDTNNPYTSTKPFNNSHADFVLGYDVRSHIAGWCIVVNRSIFDIIGLLDTTFEFYYADDDYAMSLRKHHLKHALVLNSHVTHVGGFTSKVTKNQQKLTDELTATQLVGLPKHLSREDYQWILKKPALLKGHLAFHKKWGNPRVIALKNKLFRFLSMLNQHRLIKSLYQ
jgi:hypothetical protein